MSKQFVTGVQNGRLAMKMTIDMPFVSQYAVSDCADNANHNCHARVMTIGDHFDPNCDFGCLSISLL